MKITLDKYDKVWETISVLLLLTIALILALGLPTLPDIVPIHFNLKGKADGFGSKYIFWLVFGLAILMYLVFSVISFRPGLYKSRMTENNIEQQYILTAKMARTLKMYTLILFVIITIFMLKAAQGIWTEHSPYLILTVFLLVLPPTFYYVIKLSKIR